MKNEIAVPQTANAQTILPSQPTDKNTVSRLRQFADWLDETGQTWSDPDLAAYRDHLLTRLSPSSVAAHLSSIRGRYRTLLRNRDLFWAMTPLEADPVARKAFVDEKIERLRNALDPDEARISVTKKQDRADSEHIRLTKKQARALIEKPGITTLKGIRDTAIIVLLLATGIREAELVALTVEDLRQRLGGELALRIRHGKGNKQRLVPYGEFEWALVYVEAWLNSAVITEGPVFRSFTSVVNSQHPTGNIQNKPLSVRAVQQMLESRTLMIDGKLRAIRPHDLRRTYARLLWEAGVPPVAIQQNLGHTSLQTTLGYIGDLNGDQRKPPSIFDSPYDLADVVRLRQETFVKDKSNEIL